MFKNITLVLLIATTAFSSFLLAMEEQEISMKKRAREETKQDEKQEKKQNKKARKVENREKEKQEDTIQEVSPLIELQLIGELDIAHEDYGGEKHEGKEFLNTSKNEPDNSEKQL